MDIKVNTFLIGPPRCASTSLAELLSQHPYVCFSKPKEPTYFCEDLPAGYENEPKNIQEYHARYFSHYDPESHEIVCDGTPLYLMSECAISKIIVYNPNAKFIGLVRNPIDIAQSMHAARVRAGMRHENIPDFEDAWNAQNDRLNGKRIPQNVVREGVLQYKRLASIGSHYQRLFEKVSKEQIHLIYFEELHDGFSKISGDLFNFLEIPLLPQINNIHKEAAAQWRSETIRRLNHQLKHIANLLPIKPNLGIFKKLDNISKKGGNMTLRPEFRAKLREEFSDEIELLSDVLNRDFSHWK